MDHVCEASALKLGRRQQKEEMCVVRMHGCRHAYAWGASCLQQHRGRCPWIPLHMRAMKGTPHVRHPPARSRAAPETPFTSLTQEDPGQEVFLDLLQLLSRSPHACGPRWPRVTHKEVLAIIPELCDFRIFPSQGLNQVPYIGMQILNHWTARKVPQQIFNLTSFQKIIMV